MKTLLSGACAASLALALGLAGPAAARPAGSGSVMAVVFLDTSTEGAMNGVRADETARLAMVERLLGEAFAEEGIEMIDRAPVQAALDRVQNPANCNGCDAKAARELGVDLAVSAEVQKVSNLILTINVFVRDAATGRMLRAGNADIRGNTDDSWRRGLGWILRNRIFSGGPIEID